MAAPANTEEANLQAVAESFASKYQISIDAAYDLLDEGDWENYRDVVLPATAASVKATYAPVKSALPSNNTFTPPYGPDFD
jgi:hypothetical protein